MPWDHDLLGKIHEILEKAESMWIGNIANILTFNLNSTSR